MRRRNDQAGQPAPRMISAWWLIIVPGAFALGWMAHDWYGEPPPQRPW